MAKSDPALLTAKIKRAQEILYKVSTPEYPVIDNTGVSGPICPFSSFQPDFCPNTSFNQNPKTAKTYHRFQKLQKTEHVLIIDYLDNVFKSVDITYIDKMLNYNPDCLERRPLRD